MCSKTLRQERQAHCADKMPKSITCQRRGELEKDWYSLSCSLCLYLFLSASSLSPQRVCYRFPVLLHCKTNCQNSQRWRERDGERKRGQLLCCEEVHYYNKPMRQGNLQLVWQHTDKTIQRCRNSLLPASHALFIRSEVCSVGEYSVIFEPLAKSNEVPNFMQLVKREQ